MSKSVFLSYSQNDISFAKHVAKVTGEHGIQVWIDFVDVPLATSWSASIGKALMDCRALFLVVSHSSLQSDYVRQEIQYARSHQKAIYAFWIDNVPLPPELLHDSKIHFADLRSDPFSEERLGIYLSALNDRGRDPWLQADELNTSQPVLPELASEYLTRLPRLQGAIAAFHLALLGAARNAAQFLGLSPNIGFLAVLAIFGVASISTLEWAKHRIKKRTLGSNLALVIIVVGASQGLIGIFVAFGLSGGRFLDPTYEWSRDSILIVLCFAAAGFSWMGLTSWTWIFREIERLQEWLPRATAAGPLTAWSLHSASPALPLLRSASSLERKPQDIVVVHHSAERHFARWVEQEICESDALQETNLARLPIETFAKGTTPPSEQTVIIPIISPTFIKDLYAHEDAEWKLRTYPLLPLLFQTTSNPGIIGRLQWIDARKEYCTAVYHLLNQLCELPTPIQLRQVPERGNLLERSLHPPAVSVCFALVSVMVVWFPLTGLLWMTLFKWSWQAILCQTLYGLLTWAFFFASYSARKVSLRSLRTISWLFGVTMAVMLFDHLYLLVTNSPAFRWIGSPQPYLAFGIIGISGLLTGFATWAFSAPSLLRWMGLDAEELTLWDPGPSNEAIIFRIYGILTLLTLMACLFL